MKENTYTFSKTKEEWYKEENICNECGFSLWIPFNPNYDGIIKEEK